MNSNDNFDSRRTAKKPFNLDPMWVLLFLFLLAGALLRRTGRPEEADTFDRRAEQALYPVTAPRESTSIQEIKTVLPVRNKGIQEGEA